MASNGSIGHLHTHSYFSLLEGVASPGELVQCAARDGAAFLGLTDHWMLTGAVEFFKACRDSNIQPVLGLEVDLSIESTPGGRRLPEQGPLVLLAQDQVGWSSLCHLSSEVLAVIAPDNPVCTLEQLHRWSNGIICLTGGYRSLVTRWVEMETEQPAHHLLSAFQDIFQDRLYVELQHYRLADERLNHSLHQLASRLSVPVVATHGVYYLTPHQAPLQKTLSAIRTNKAISQLPDGSTAPTNSHLINTTDLASRFKNFPQALTAQSDIAARCNLDLRLGQHDFPSIPVPSGETALSVLRRKAVDGARMRYGQLTPAIQTRLDHELEVIAASGYETIFLIVEDIFHFARQSGIPTSSRGSAASSIVSHCLGITTPDPIALNLYFERFLNPARSSPPDIDTDLCSRRRDEVIQHVFDTYGDNRVAMVCTINRFRSRSALSDVAKAFGLASSEIHALARNLPHRFFHLVRGGSETDDLKSLVNSHKLPPGSQLPQIVDQAIALLNLPRHLSVHAGGLVISPAEMTDRVPVLRSGSKGVIITQLDLDSVEEMGLVKIDLLGIRGLTVLGDVASAIQSWERRKYQNRLDVLDAIPLDDAPTAEIIAAGRTIGCFQIESPGMRATLKEIQARKISDIIAALALYRPGPLKGGLRDAFVRRHKQLEPVDHIHPSLAPILDESQGVILYQEQVLRLAHEIGGFSLADSDLLRRAMSHFDPGKQMQTLKEKFIQGAYDRQAVPPETGERLWEMMASFAGYGFPKAHAASYALVAWHSAWCKVHHPAEFIAAVLANWGGYYSQRVYMAEARRLGLKIKPPNVNHSRNQFSVAYPGGEPVLYMGLDQVKSLTSRTQQSILSLRPFRSYEDFVTRVDPRVQEAENLIKVGALAEFGPIPGLLSMLEHGHWQIGQPSLFAESFPNPGSEDWPIEKRMAAQEDLLGISVDIHPLELFSKQIAAAGVVSTIQAADTPGSTVRVAGMRQTLHRSRTERGETMAFLTIEDLEGMLDVVIFPSLYQRCRNVISESVNLILEGTIELDVDRSEPVLKAAKVWPLR